MKTTAYFHGILIIALFTTACYSSSFGGLSKGGKQANASREAAAAGSTQSNKLKVEYDTFADLSFDKQLEVSIENFVAIARTVATNEPLEILGYSFFNLSDKLQEHEDELSQLDDKYKNLGDFLKTSAIYSENDITPERVEAGLASLEKSMQSSTNSPSSASPSASVTELSTILGSQLTDPARKDRYLLGVASLSLMRGYGSKLQLLGEGQQAASAIVQANSDKGWANPQGGDEPGLCVNVIFVGTLDNPECLDAEDRMTPCPCT